MKKYWIVLFSLFCLLMGAANVQGAQAHLKDEAALLAEDEAEVLNLYLGQVSADFDIDIAVVTVNSIGDTTMEAYADDYYDENGFGEDGVLLLVDMGSRGYWISTSGRCIAALSDDAIEAIGSELAEYLADAYYMDALCVFAEDVENYMTELYGVETGASETEGASGKAIEDQTATQAGPTDIPNQKNRNEKKLAWQEDGKTIIGVAVVLGLIVAIAVTAVWKGQLRSVRAARDASQYVKRGSFLLSRREDRFLYRNVTKTPRPKNPPPENHSSGGGSTHIGSSGRTHGGGGGHF